MNKDEIFMLEALKLAKKGRGTTRPNPMVGALIVKDGEIVGRGWHEKAGGPHAEVVAIREAGVHAKGAILYVTLEPCCHVGRTPPCTDLIIRTGIRKVVCAMQDPNLKVAGKGFAKLEEAGIEIKKGICQHEAEELNAGYLMNTLFTRPYVYGKMATSIDGRIATRSGDSQWITCESSRRDSHRLRNQVDAICVGINTILADNPQLTVRYGVKMKQPMRVVWDTHLRIPLTAEVVIHNPENTTIFTIEHRDKSLVKCLRNKGVQVVTLPADVNGHVDIVAGLRFMADQLSIQTLLVEGGSTLMGAFADLHLLDEIWTYIAPKLIGGKEAISAVGGIGINILKDADTYLLKDICSISNDIRVIYRRELCLQD